MDFFPFTSNNFNNELSFDPSYSQPILFRGNSFGDRSLLFERKHSASSFNMSRDVSPIGSCSPLALTP